MSEEPAAGRPRRVPWGEAATVGVVAVYALVLLAGSGAYSYEARLFPIVVTGLTLVVCTAYVAVLISRARHPAEVEGDQQGEPSAPDPSEQIAESDHTATTGQARSLVGVLLPALGLLFIAGIYMFAVVLTVAFMRRLGSHVWTTTLMVAAGLVVFSWIVLNLLVNQPVPEWGLLGMWLAQ